MHVVYDWGVRAWWLMFAGCAFRAGGAPNDASGPGEPLDAPAHHGDGAAAAQPPVLQDQNGAFNNLSNVFTILQGNVGVGDIELVLVTWQDNGATLTGVSDQRGSGSGTFNMLVGPTSGGSPQCALLWERVEKAISPENVTAQFSSNVNSSIVAAEYSNVPPSGAAVFDGTERASIVANAASVSVTTTTTQGNDMLVALAGTDQANGGANPTAGPGYMSKLALLNVLVEQQVETVPGSYTASVSFDRDTDACIAITGVMGN